MTTAAPAPAPPAAPADGEVLALADGVELIGEFEGSGFKEPPLLARRADGQVIQLRRLLYLIADAADGRRDARAVAAVVSEHYGRNVTARSVLYLVERTLRPLGVLAQADGTTPALPKRAPVMALRHRRALVPERGVNAVARCFTWLHRPPVLLLILLALAAFDAWLFGVHGIAAGLRAVLYQPALLLAVPASIVVATAFHEIGHASACRYGGARPGVMGAGVYLVWPAFYCDVTDAYRLGRGGRLRTDLGGVYFNGIFALAAGIAGLATGQEALFLIAFVQHTIVLQQLLPLLRFDGYYVLSDLTGVPDILSRIKPIFRSLVPWRAAEPKVEELKPWVRVLVTAYLAALVPTLAFMVASSVVAAPRMLATAYDSLGLQLDRIGSAHGTAEAALGVFRIGALVFPIAAIAVSLSRSGRMAGRGLLAWSRGSATRRIVAVAATAAVAGGAAYTWWPNGDYQPLRPGERGTVGDALSSLKNAPGGRGSFTPQRERRFGPVSTVRRQEAARPHGRARSLRPAGEEPPQRLDAAPTTGHRRDAAPADRQSDLPGEDDAGVDPRGRAGSDSATATPAPAASSESTATPTPTSTATPTPTTPTPTPTPSETSTATATATATPTATATATPTPASAAESTASPSPSTAQADSATATPTP